MDFKEKLNVISNIFFNCMILGFATLLLVFFAMLFLDDFVFSFHSQMFNISREQFNVIMYSLLTGYKSLVILLFAFPWISIKLVLKKM